ncbi:uncharacterized protein METZ01_LOCUS114475, partial [marine metagenome]
VKSSRKTGARKLGASESYVNAQFSKKPVKTAIKPPLIPLRCHAVRTIPCKQKA